MHYTYLGKCLFTTSELEHRPMEIEMLSFILIPKSFPAYHSVLNKFIEQLKKQMNARSRILSNSKITDLQSLISCPS